MTPCKSTTLEEMETELREALLLYEDDKLFQAARKFELLETQLEEVSQRAGSSPSEVAATEAFRQRWTSDERIGRIKKRSEECTRLLHDCDSTAKGWEVAYDGQSTKVWYRREPNSAIHSCRAEGIIQADFVKVACLIYETELYHQFWPFVKEMKELRSLGRCSKAVEGIYQLFWPISEREIPIFGYGVDGLDEDDCFLLFFRNLCEEDRDLKSGEAISLPPVPKRAVRMEMSFSGMRFEPISPYQTKMTILCNIDPKLPQVPTPIINWATRTIFRYSLRILEYKANELDKMPAHVERLGTNPFYAYFGARVNAYLTKKGFDLSDRVREEERAKQLAQNRSSFDGKREAGATLKPPAINLFGFR